MNSELRIASCPLTHCPFVIKGISNVKENAEKSIVFCPHFAYNNSAAGSSWLYTRETERKFKRYVLSPDAGPLKSGFFLTKEKPVDIFIYSDESGVFDVEHNQYFAFGGVMFLDRDAKDNCARKYLKAEGDVRRAEEIPTEKEVKACSVSNKGKSKLFRSLNNQIRFGVIIDQAKILTRIWQSKKDKQRYLDYAYKIAVKRCFEWLIKAERIEAEKVDNLYFFVDEHTTATNGHYELRESLEQEFKNGTYNYTWSRYFPPPFPGLRSVDLRMCNSSKKPLIRAADIVANKIYFCARTQKDFMVADDDFFVIRLP